MMNPRGTALAALIRKDLILYFSNRRALLITLAAPIAIAAFFGSLFGGPKDSERSKIPIAIIDVDRSPASTAVVKSMSADATFDVQPLDASAASDAVRRGKLRAVVTIPAAFGAQAPPALFGSSIPPVIDIQYDPSQGMVLQVIEGLLTRHVLQGVAQVAFSSGNAETLPGGSGRGGERSTGPSGQSMQMPFTTRETASKSGAAKYNAYSHSFAGMGVQFILFMGIDLGIKLLTMRRMGLWQRLRAAPLSRGFLLASQVGSGAIIATLLFTAIFAAGILVFGVRVQGSVPGFVGLVIAFAAMTAAFGLFIAALGRTPEATRGLAIFATLVMVMLGGAWVPAFIFPQWLQTLSLAMPTRWAVDGFDAVTWRGLGFEAAWLPIIVMLLFTLLFAAIAVWQFRWDEK